MSGSDLLFAIFALATCGGAIAVVCSQNLARMAFWLIISLGSTSGLFFLLNADFVGATQLLVYVGGTLVLLVFGVMLTASGPFTSMKTSPAEGFLAAGIGVLFLAMIIATVSSVDWGDVNGKLMAADRPVAGSGHNPAGQGNTVRPIGMALLGVRPDLPNGGTGYLLPFEIASVHLLVVLIGAAYLARAKRRIDTVDE